MKKKLLAFALAGITGVFASPLLAADPKAPEPDFTITGNLGLVSDYVFRGISQTDNGPAIQGGFDYSHKSGLYVGTWGSNVSSWASLNGSGAEIDIYGGFKGLLPSEISYDIGVIAYRYPGTTSNPKQNSAELYLGISSGPISYKLSRTMSTGWFGIGPVGNLGTSAKGSLYHDLTATLGLTESTIVFAHIGLQKLEARDGSGVIARTVDPSFKDYKLGVSQSLSDGFSLGLEWVSVKFDQDAAKGWFTNTNGGRSERLYNNSIVISVKKTF
jgi:uncharacterized protein (TIGR02001 family)